MIFHLFKLFIFLTSGLLQISREGDDRIWANIKTHKNLFWLPKKSLDQKINPQKIQQPQNKLGFTLIAELREAGIRRYYHESSDCFEYPKNHY